MIDYLISDKEIELIWSCILKVMNFLILMSFSRNFLNFYKFILDLFGFLKIIKSFYCELTWLLTR